MQTATVEKVGLPGETLAQRAFPRIDYADAYQFRLPPGHPGDLDSVVRAVFAGTPGWIRALMSLRNRIVRVFGLKTEPPQPLQAHLPLQPGATVGIFRVFERSADEILMGEDDRHLDFRVSVLLRSDRHVVVSTVVRFNNWLGRAYFVPVRPFHQLIVPALIRYGLRNGR